MLAGKALAQFVLRLIALENLGNRTLKAAKGPLFSEPEKEKGEDCEWEKGGVQGMSQGQVSEESSGLSPGCKAQTKACHSEPIRQSQDFQACPYRTFSFD